jgi:hypothetical protein
VKKHDELTADDDWQSDWEGHRTWQLTSALAATPAQRLEWLEQAIEFAWRCGALPKPEDHKD